MGKWTQEIIGGLEVAGGAALVATGVGAPIGAELIAAGVGTTISGLGTLFSKGPAKGFATTERNPTAPWQVIYGRARVGGSIVYLHTWPGTDDGSNQILDMVIVLAAHGIQSVDAVLFDQQRVQIDTNARVNRTQLGTGSLSAGPDPATGTSFTPVQQKVNCSSIQRSNGVVTVTLPANIPFLIEGDQIQIAEDGAGSLTANGLVGTFQ